VLAVAMSGWADRSQVPEAMKRARYDGANIHVLPTGYDAHFWKPAAPKEDFVLTVAVVRALSRIRVKGIDTLIATARRLPHVRFVLVGTAIRRSSPRKGWKHRLAFRFPVLVTVANRWLKPFVPQYEVVVKKPK